ncbi:MAG: anion permease [Enterococcus sp.]|nr:anion permease [Enterococcus sp.]
MTIQTIITILVFATTIASFCFRSVPMAASAIAAALILVLTGCIEPKAFLSNVANDTVLTMVSMFVVASSLNKTSLIDKLSELVKKISGGSLTKVLTAYVILTFILGQFIPSITATFTIVAPLAASVSKKMGIAPSKIIFSIGLVTVATSFTIYPIGPMAGSFVEDNGYLTQFGAGAYQFDLFSETIVKIFPSIFILIWAIFVSPKLCPEISDFSKLEKLGSLNKNTSRTIKSIKTYQELLVYIIFTFVIISFLFGSFGFPIWVIPASGAVILVFARILQPSEAIKNMNIDIILLYIGVITIGSALGNTNAGQMIGDFFAQIFLVTQNSYVVGIVVFLAAFIMTSLLFNRAVGKVLVPIIIMACVPLNADPRGLMCICYTASMLSLVTPMSTSIVPMMMGAVGYRQKDLLKMGLVPGLIAGLITVAVAMTIFPCF